MEKVVPTDITAVSVTISGGEPGTYHVRWWDTNEGQLLNEKKVTGPDRSLTILPPRFQRDSACKLNRLDAGQ